MESTLHTCLNLLKDFKVDMKIENNTATVNTTITALSNTVKAFMLMQWNRGGWKFKKSCDSRRFWRLKSTKSA